MSTVFQIILSILLLILLGYIIYEYIHEINDFIRILMRLGKSIFSR